MKKLVSAVLVFFLSLSLLAQNQKKAYLAPATQKGAEWETNATKEDKNNNPEDILLLHPDKDMVPRLAQYKWRMPAWKVKNKPQPSFVMLHFSDLHSSSTELKRIMVFYNYYEEYFDAVVSTGDAIHHWALDDSFWKADGASKVLPVLGNHEVFAPFNSERTVKGVPLKKWYSPSFSEKEAYQRYFKPYLEETQFTEIPEGKCYWYKDFREENVRLIGLDHFHWNERVALDDGHKVHEYPDGEKTDKGEQLAWFKKTLADAREKGLSVICVDHCPCRDDRVEPIDCPFTSVYRPGGTRNNHNPGQVEAVDEFIVNGGDFVAWIGGHLHYDLFSIINAEHSKQLSVALDKASREHTGEMKFAGTVSEDLFTVIAVDPRVGYITFQRIGPEYDTYGRHIGTLVYNYREKKIVCWD